VGGSLLLSAGVLGLVPDGAQATTLTQAGWWWRVNDPALPVTVPAPPTVPEGALMVSGAPDGATAIAALHFEVHPGEGAPVLTLEVAENGDQGADDAVLAACLTGSAWQPEHGGAWVNKPFAACDEGSVTGVRSEDGRTWTFALAPLLSDGIVDVTLVPGVEPDLPAGANGSTFQLVFTAPTAGSLATTSQAGPTPSIEVPTFGATASPDVATGTFDPPPLGGDLVLPEPASVFTPALPEADQGLTATAPVVQQRNAPLPASAAQAVPDHRQLALAILATCGAALVWSARLPAPAPRRLSGLPSSTAPAGTPSASPPAAGGAPAVAPAGLGRHARVRSGPAPRL
jgi:hypothetical protein